MTLNSINTGGGCEITDKIFSNFSSNPAGDAATIEMLNSSVAGTVGSNTITGLLSNFDAPGLWQLTPNATTTSVFTYSGQIDNSAVSAPSTGAWDLTKLTLVESFNPGNASQMNNGDSLSVLMQFCPGTAIFSPGCANLQFIQAVLTKNPTLTLTYSSSSGSTDGTLDISSLGVKGTYAVQDTLTFVGTASGSTFALTGISNGFDETGIAPEPSTFGLFGLGLAGLGAMAYRRNSRLSRLSPSKTS